MRLQLESGIIKNVDFGYNIVFNTKDMYMGNILVKPECICETVLYRMLARRVSNTLACIYLMHVCTLYMHCILYAGLVCTQLLVCCLLLAILNSFNDVDRDKNDKLSYEEFQEIKVQTSRRFFDLVDSSNDGFITLSEVNRILEQLEDGPI